LRRNCLVKYVTVGKMGEIEWEGGQGRRSKQLMDDVKETKRILEIGRGSTRSYCVCRTHFGRGYGLVR